MLTIRYSARYLRQPRRLHHYLSPPCSHIQSSLCSSSAKKPTLLSFQKRYLHATQSLETTNTTSSSVPEENNSDKKVLSKDIQEKLDHINDLLALSLADPDYGVNRGVDIQVARLRHVAPSNAKRRKVNSNVARSVLARLLYQRHSLQHGYEEISEMHKQNVLASSFLGEGTKVPNLTVMVARKILKEQFRYGESPTLRVFLKRDAEVRSRQERTQDMQKAAALRKSLNRAVNTDHSKVMLDEKSKANVL